jgi:hypothetical protein
MFFWVFTEATRTNISGSFGRVVALTVAYAGAMFFLAPAYPIEKMLAK